MSIGYRLHFLALGGFLVLALCTGECQAQSNSYPVDQQTQSDTASPDLYTAPNCERPKNSEEANFCVQRHAAEASERQAIWTERQFWLGVVGLFAVLATLIYSARAAKAGRDAAVAAAEGNRIARTSHEAERRPWIEIESLKVGPRGLYFDVNGANLHVIFTLKNHGVTPAVTVRLEGGPRIDVGPNTAMVELERICDEARATPAHPRMFANTIFPNSRLTLDFVYSFASAEMLTDIKENRHGFFSITVIGCVDYFFTFGTGDHHQSRFVFNLMRPMPNGGWGSFFVDGGDRPATAMTVSPETTAAAFRAD